MNRENQPNRVVTAIETAFENAKIVRAIGITLATTSLAFFATEVIENPYKSADVFPEGFLALTMGIGLGMILHAQELNQKQK